MKRQQSTSLPALVLVAFAMGAPMMSQLAWGHDHTTATTAQASRGLAPATDIVDGYLNRILCENKGPKLWQENIQMALSGPKNLESMNAAFAGEIYYSLPPGSEKRGKDYVKNSYSSALKVLANLRSLAVFFGHDIHNLFNDENQQRQKTGKPLLTKEDFVRKFAAGEIAMRAEGIDDLRTFVQTRIDEIESLTKDLQYGCHGDQNFLHRKGSQLSARLSPSAFLIPATDHSLQIAQRLQAPHPERTVASLPPAAPTPTAAAAATEASATELPVYGASPTKNYAKFLSQGVPKRALDEALASYALHQRKGESLSSHRMVVVDYPSDSSEPRFWVLNLVTGNATGMKTGHGNGDFNEQINKMPKGRMAFVSNSKSSHASSAGAMVLNSTAGVLYENGQPKMQNGKPVRVSSKFQMPVRLRGLEARNSNVDARDIIIHEGVNRGNTYVNDNDNDEAGRSHGCFALSPENAAWVYRNLPAGTFLYAYQGNIPQANTVAEAKQALNRLNNR